MGGLSTESRAHTLRASGHPTPIHSAFFVTTNGIADKKTFGVRAIGPLFPPGDSSAIDEGSPSLHY